MEPRRRMEELMSHFTSVLLAGGLALAAQPVAAQSIIRPGDAVEGQLSRADRLLDDGSFYDCFNLQAPAGERVQITLRSGDFDAYLAVVQGADCPAGGDVGGDDDGAGGTDSRAEVTIGPGGYSIRANSLNAGETGRYTLTVERLAARPAPEPVALGRGQAQRFGSLGEGDAIAADGSFFDCYSFDVSRGQTRRIRLMSQDFDAFLSLHEGGRCDAEIDTDDDGLGMGTDALIERTFDRNGRYSIRANSLSPGETGRYRLVLEDR
ncbi:peptidase [Brevundimonas sp. FT23042]|uniref:peptidase n=1 Tax=Brevundimonas sp. FT23042 TaxID=3393749 RepID=UPI003B5875F1